MGGAQAKYRTNLIARINAELDGDEDVDTNGTNRHPNLWYDTYVQDMINKRQDCSDLLNHGLFSQLANMVLPNRNLSRHSQEWPGHSRAPPDIMFTLQHTIAAPTLNTLTTYRKQNITNFKQNCHEIITKRRIMSVQQANEVWLDEMSTVHDYIFELDVAADLVFIALQLRTYFTQLREGRCGVDAFVNNNKNNDTNSSSNNEKEMKAVYDSIESSDVNQLFSMTSTPVLFEQFVVTKRLIMEHLIAFGPVDSLARLRLEQLGIFFNQYCTTHHLSESQMLANAHEDIASVDKIDNHIHLAAAMISDELLQELQSAWKESHDSKIKHFLNDLGNANVNTAVVHQNDTFKRFDRFDRKYSLLGHTEIRNMFLKHFSKSYAPSTIDEMTGSSKPGVVRKGHYLKNMTKKINERLQRNNQYAEVRISLNSSDEMTSEASWRELAEWDHDIPKEDIRISYLIQLTREPKCTMKKLFSKLHKVFDFAIECLETCNPEDVVYKFLMERVNGFDVVGDEASNDVGISSASRSTDESTLADFDMFSFYTFLAVAKLNTILEKRPFPSINKRFELRPHSGEAGRIDHLVTSYLLADGINHGINLKNSDALQYLYYLSQVSMSMSPICNDNLFLRLKENPMPLFYQRGLFVTLSTDDPLFFHRSEDPLQEEYSVAANAFGLNMIALCEIANNSVLISNDQSIAHKRQLQKSTRSIFRLDVWEQEMKLIDMLRQVKWKVDE